MACLYLTQALDIPGMKALNAVTEVGSRGMETVTSVAMTPVNIVGAALSKVGSAIAVLTPYPIRVVAGYLWSWVPEIESPFFLVVMMVQFASDIEWYKRMTRLLFKMMTGSGREAACDFCDEMITQVMDLEDTKDDAQDADELCDAVCPFNLQYCIDMCKTVMEAIGSSTKFPCEVCVDRKRGVGRTGGGRGRRTGRG
jgi:hypothetical protein